LWLSDGMDRPPLTSKINVLEKGEDGLVLTGSEILLKGLAGIEGARVAADIVVHGHWNTPDGINVNIGSVLVSPRKAKRLAKQLIDEDPLSVWIPAHHAYEGEIEHLWGEKTEYESWIVAPEAEGWLDADDPLGGIDAERRPRFAEKIVRDYSLRPADPFARLWRAATRRGAATSEAWGHGGRYEGSFSGVRLNCTPDLLTKVLSDRNRELLLLITLQRYEERVRGSSDSRFSNTVAVVRIKNDLRYEYLSGAVNQIHKSSF
jgi:hypothetical protein